MLIFTVLLIFTGWLNIIHSAWLCTHDSALMFPSWLLHMVNTCYTHYQYMYRWSTVSLYTPTNTRLHVMCTRNTRVNNDEIDTHTHMCMCMYLYGVRESNYLFIVGRELCTDHPSTATSTRTGHISHSDIIKVIYLKGIVHCLWTVCNIHSYCKCWIIVSYSCYRPIVIQRTKSWEAVPTGWDIRPCK